MINFFKTMLTLLLLLTALPAYSGSSVKWYSFNKGLIEAKKTNKPILINFTAAWCRYCTLMDKNTFSNPIVAERLKKNFISIRIDIESKTDIIKFRGRNFSPKRFFGAVGGSGLPTVVFMNKKGEFITKIPGYIKKDIFLPLLRYIENKCYLSRTPFNENYIKGKKDCKK